MMNLKSIVRALAHRNYRLFFLGQSVSLIGTWMQQIAMAWLVYRLTDSSVLLGAVSFASQIPAFFVAPLTGVLTDRWNQHRALIVTQTLMMLQAFALAFLAMTGAIQVWHLIVLGTFLGVVSAFDMTIRQAFLREMVTRKEDWANAIALNSSMFNGARLVGPAVAGLVIAATSEGICFLLNGISYLAVIVALLAMRVERRPQPERPRLLRGLHEGIAYVFSFAPIHSVLLLLALVSLVGMPYSVLLPIVARDILRGGAATLGFLTAAAGVGALAGALYLAARQTVLGLGIRIAVMPAVFGFSLIVFAYSSWLLLSLLMLFLMGFAGMVQMAASNTILQTITDDDKRGRVMSFYTMAFMGMMPVGCLIAGAFASTRLQASGTMALGGAICVVAAGWFAAGLPSLRAQVRPLYVKIGILPEVAAGLEAVAEMRVPPEG
jgi:MFS family permease